MSRFEMKVSGYFNDLGTQFIFRGKLKCDSTRAETRFRLLAKQTSPFRWAVASVHSTAGSRGLRIGFYCWQ
jgi:hypothetical protein